MKDREGEIMVGDPPYPFVWTSHGDAQKIWRRYGWKPPTEYRYDYMFKHNRDIVQTTTENLNG
jgi:hypothetical protein